MGSSDPGTTYSYVPSFLFVYSRVNEHSGAGGATCTASQIVSLKLTPHINFQLMDSESQFGSLVS